MMKRPKAVIALSGIYALAAFLALINAFSGQPFSVLNALLAGSLAVGLWQMKNWARRIVILLLTLGLIAGICVGIAIYVPLITQRQQIPVTGSLIGVAVLGMVGFLVRHLMSAGIRQGFSTK